jgi:hypothetical protein
MDAHKSARAELESLYARWEEQQLLLESAAG